uniref:Coiled-coil domain containing 15 n=1 Tax=Mola mola TaxID=94237 RepID=A0A3Q3X2R6_MOLML
KVISLCIQQKAASHVDEENVEEEGVDQLFTSQHDCPLVHHKVYKYTSFCGLFSSTHHEYLKRIIICKMMAMFKQKEFASQFRQTQFLMHRRLYMSIEREQVKENQQYRKHLKRTARIKAEKEQIRLEEERKLERARQLAEAREKLEERELLILEQLKLEEEEERALRAQMKDRLSQDKLELPPLCYCASSFWDSHPDTCANNCVFHNNPKGNHLPHRLLIMELHTKILMVFVSSTAYAKALQSIVLSLDLE